jgi:hypothetical protein
MQNSGEGLADPPISELLFPSICLYKLREQINHVHPTLLTIFTTPTYDLVYYPKKSWNKVSLFFE